MASEHPESADLPEALEAAVYELCLGGHDSETGISKLKRGHPSHAPAIDRLVRSFRRADSAVGSVRTAARAALREQLPEGAVVGPYVVVREIGRGAFGRVYLADQAEPVRRQVALKVLSALGTAPDVMARFASERQVLAQLEHPGIARILDAGTTAEGQPYFAMEYLPGQPIQAFADERRLSIDARLRLFLQVCAAVQHAHQRGVIHRDIKPGNLLVLATEAGPQAKVIDFGLAKVLADDPALGQPLATESGRLLGTPEYMSPEQAAGAPIDTRTDIYSLGSVLYELLCGRLPFPSERLREHGLQSVIRLLAEEEPPLPSASLSQNPTGSAAAANRGANARDLALRLRGDLDQIVRCCLEKDRERRYPAVAGLAADVERHLAHLPVSVRRPTLGYLFARFARRHRGAVVASLVAAAALLVGALATFWSLYRVTVARDDALAAEAAALRNAYAMAIASAQAAGEACHTGVMRDLLAGTAEDQRRIEWDFLNARTEDALQVLPVGASQILTLGVYGDRIGLFDRRSMQWIEVDARRGVEIACARWPWQVNCSAVSADGRWLALGGVDGDVEVLDSRTLRHRHRLRAGNGEVKGLEFTPDGQSLVVGAANEALRVRLDDGRTVARRSAAGGHIVHLDLAASGAVAAFGDSGGTATVWHVGEDRVLARLKHPASVHAVSLHRDGTLVATTCRDRVLRLWDVANSQLLAEQTLRGEILDCLAYLPDGSILTGQSNGSVRWWDGRTLRNLGFGRGHQGRVTAIHCCADGTVLTAALDGTLRRWAHSPPRDHVPLPGMYGTTRFLRPHPHLPRIFATSLGGDVACWDLDTRKLLWKRSLLAGMCEGIAVAADGRRLFVADEAGFVHALDAEHGGPLQKRRLFPDRLPRQLHLQPDGRTLVVSLTLGELAIVDVATLAVLQRLGRPNANARWETLDMVVHPGGALATICMVDGGMRTLDLTTGGVAWDLPSIHAICATFCPRRGILCIGDTRGAILELEPRTGRVLRTLRKPGPDQAIAAMQFTADGSRLLVASRRNLILDPRDGVELLAFDNDRYPPGALLLVEDRQVLVTGGGYFTDAAEVLLWPLAAAAR